MKFFIDNNLPRDLAHGLAGLSKSFLEVERVVHLTDLFDGNAKDLVWIPALGEGGAKWYIVSIDKFRKNKSAEREAIRRCGHTVYVLDPQWSQHRYWMQCARLVLWWPQILQHAGLTSGGVHRVPWRHTSQSKFVAL